MEAKKRLKPVGFPRLKDIFATQREVYALVPKIVLQLYAFFPGSLSLFVGVFLFSMHPFSVLKNCDVPMRITMSWGSFIPLPSPLHRGETHMTGI